MSDYLTREKGTIRKKWTGRLPIALVYPNTYPVASSNLGFQLIYALLNRQDDIVCERFAYPEGDQPLRSLETGHPLKDFPVIMGSVSFEEDYPRLAALLGAGWDGAAALNRPQQVTAGSPLVLLGGVALFMNPEPLAPFADIIVIGEAEAVLEELVRSLVNMIGAGTPRQEIVRSLATSVGGCYAPSLYTFRHAEQGSVVAITPQPGIPERVRKVTAGRMDHAAHSQLFSPDAELSMFMTELGRGCSRGCRFCAAGFIYRPPRLWDVEQVMAGLANRPEGMDRVGLLGMEMAGTRTLEEISAYLETSDCSLSFSSLRADRISPPLVSLLGSSGLKSAAIAPDGASERLRRVINKGLTEEDLLGAATALVSAGIVNLKLYVMVGLPTETEDDLDELTSLVRRLRRELLPIGRARGRVCSLTLSVNSFVPKAWTPFQYHSYGGLDADAAMHDRDGTKAVLALKTKIKYLRKQLATTPNLQIRADRPERVLLQAVLARGDRRLGPVLADMAGGRSFGQAMKRAGLTAWEYAIRPRGNDELFPWDVIDHGISKKYLWREYQKGMEEKLTQPCDTSRCRSCGVCNEAVSS